MLKDRNIALFIDIDNCDLTYENFISAVSQLKEMGNLVYGKAYGLSDRKHKEIIDKVADYGFDMANVMRVKKRGSKVFDNKIIVDVMDAVLSYSHIDTVCIVCAPSDMVYFYSKLHTYGVKVIALNNLDEQSLEFVDQTLDIGVEEKPIVAKPAKKAVLPKTKEVATAVEKQPIVEEQPKIVEEEVKPVEVVPTQQEQQPQIEEKPIEQSTEQDEEQTINQEAPIEEVLPPIEEVPQEEVVAPATQQSAEQPMEETQEKVEEVQEQPQPQEENSIQEQPNVEEVEVVADESQKDQTPTVEVAKGVEEQLNDLTAQPVEEVKDEVNDAQPQETEKEISVNSETEDDMEILRQIEKVKQTQTATSQDDEILLAEIKRLLDEFNKDSE